MPLIGGVLVSKNLFSKKLLERPITFQTLAAILAGGVVLQAVSECPRCYKAGIVRHAHCAACKVYKEEGTGVPA